MPTIKTSYRLLLVITVAAVVCLLGTFDITRAQTPPPDFRIVDVRSEYGQMVVEVQHFMPDGSHGYFEHYTFEGREETKHPRARDSNGHWLLLENGRVAPFRLNTVYNRFEQYLPPNHSWQRQNRPHLNNDSILGVIQSVHETRDPATWPKGNLRLTTSPLEGSEIDYANVATLTARFQGLINQSYRLIDSENPEQQRIVEDGFTVTSDKTYTNVGLMPPTTIPLGREFGTVSTFYSTTTVDGDLTNLALGDTWANLYAGPATTYDDTAALIDLILDSDSVSNEWDFLSRAFILFDTSSLTSASTVTDGLVEFVIVQRTDDFSERMVVVSSTPNSDTALELSDWTDVGSASLGNRPPISTYTVDSSTYNTITLNATGEAAISLTGITKFGLRLNSDNDNSPPTWASEKRSHLGMASSDTDLGADKRLRLVVTHTTPVAAITGTIGDGATEKEVRDGGGTILVTLTDDTWVADGATFDAQRQNIIDGLDAASSPTTGWNNEVRDSIGVSSVVRTSSTLATITLAASDVAGYAIASTETITVTVPATALTSAGAITATPTIAITAVTESAAITGTIGGGATEQAVRDGGGTILITLANTTWVPAAASEFDNQRQNIIDGLVAADSQTYGWNNEVKNKLGVTAVVRTNDTLVTITIPAGDVEDYRIVTNEVITTTVPATAIGGAALVATPTTTITGTVESAAVSGTLGGSGGTAPEIEAGGETVIITLTNTTWVTAGATFNAQRQNILDGLVADDSDVNGWNAMAFAVGDVVRTSGTIVTITLSAESSYAIPSAETVTTTVPATAIVYGASLVAPETFTIAPAAFATSGTRVSTAINLSGVTDLAYCAIGWETTLPTNTAVAIETSINGGSTYSTATNGNCPTGLTLGESLASITDFRVKATLTTTDTAATPLITALGLIVEDAGGSELCYQLLTTPSASLADNCGTYTGTMSFPIGPSTITSSTAPITSTADPLPNARSLAGQDVAQAVTGSATSARLFPAAGDEGGFVGLPLNDLVNEMSTVGDGLPVRFVWFIFLGIATIGAGMMAVHLTSNLFIAAGAMAAVMGFQMAIGSTGLLPGWILFAFIPLAAAFLLFRRGFPV